MSAYLLDVYPTSNDPVPTQPNLMSHVRVRAGSLTERSAFYSVDQSLAVIPGDPESGVIRDRDGVVIVGGATGVTELSQLDDVNIPAPTNGQVLTYNSGTTKWEANTPAAGVTELSQLDDVDIPAPSNGQVLTYNTGTTKWEAVTPVPPPTSLGSLSDVQLVAEADTQVLTYNSGTSKWENQNNTFINSGQNISVTIPSPLQFTVAINNDYTEYVPKMYGGADSSNQYVYWTGFPPKGKYFTYGNLIFVFIFIGWKGYPPITGGEVRIELPFVSSDINVERYAGSLGVNTQGIVFPAGFGDLVVAAWPGEAYLKMAFLSLTGLSPHIMLTTDTLADSIPSEFNQIQIAVTYRRT